MASVYPKAGKWYMHYLDEAGRWRDRVSKAHTKTEAKRLAVELEMRCERQKLGLEALPAEDGGGTVWELLDWWLKTYSKRSPSHQGNVYTVTKHFFGSRLSTMRLAQIKAGDIERFLQGKCDDLGPQTLNHLRGYLVRAFNRARRAGRYMGINPALDVEKRQVPRRSPDYLRADEVGRVLWALAPGWRPLFATAIYTGMRRGELLGLQKSDLDLSAGLIVVTRSHERDTTKGSRAEVIPIATELRPYLKEAVASSPSELVFPKTDGTRMRRDVALEDVLRRALGRAGIVLRYEHVCRKKGCHHVEVATDAAQRECPKHNFKLWPKPIVRQIRFHDLRHTTASLLMMAGANPAAVQRILRHRDPRITTEVYGHLAPDYLRAEVDRLRFFSDSPSPRPQEPEPVRAVAVAGTKGDSFAAPVLQDSPDAQKGVSDDDAKPARVQRESAARNRRFELLTYGSGGRRSIQLS